MKKNFKKIMSLVLTVLMLVGTFSALIPMTASAETITLTPNADNWINGQNYRLETASADSYAKIEDGKLVLNIGSGDLFWIPSLTVKDNTSQYTFENIRSSADNSRLAIMNHVTTSANMYGSAICNSAQWIGYRYKWNGNGITVASYDVNYTSTNWGGTTTPNGSTHDGSWAKNTALSVRTTFETWSTSVPRTFFYENTESLDGRTSNNSTDVNFRWYPQLSTVVGTSFGLSMVSGRAEFTIDKITATNMNEIASFVETFDIQAEPENVIELTNNADNWVNGQNYRLETTKDTSSMKIVDGKLVLKMSAGDAFWIPSLTVKDTTSEVNFSDMTTNSNGTRIGLLSHISPKADGVKMYSAGIANNGSNVWVVNRQQWQGNGITVANYDKNYTNITGWSDTDERPADGTWDTNETLNIRNIYANWGNLTSKTFFNIGNTTSKVIIYPSIDTGCQGTSVGLHLINGTDITITIDTITAANMNEVASYTETFDEIDTTKPACISDAMVNLSLDGVIGLNFTFNASATTPADATVVATMNGETVAEAPVVKGANTVTVPVTAKEMIDDVNFAIKVNGELFEEQSYTTSVAKYAAELKKEAEWAELMDAMLKYGAAAQLLLDYKADNLAADVNGVTYDFSDYEAIDYEGNTSLLKGLYVNLTLEADTTLKLYFKPADDVTLNVTVNGEAATVVDNGDGYYVVAIDGIAADKLLEDVFVVVNGDLTFYISALDWAKVASESDDANVAIVANALAAYGDAASKKA